MGMKMKRVSQALALLGVLLVVYAIVGRFVGGPMIFSWLIPGGMSAGNGMIGANTLLLFAILADACAGKSSGPVDAGLPK